MNSRMSPGRIAGIVFAVLLSVAVANYDKLLPHSWQKYSAPDGSFSIDLPGKPTVETTQIPLEGSGTAPLVSISAQPTDTTIYTCTYIERENIALKTPDEALDSARDGSLHKTQGALVTQRRLRVQNYPALEFQARARGNSLMDSRMIVVGRRLYMIMAVATVERQREEKSIQRMYDSFKITER